LKINSDLKLKKELETVYIDSSGKKHLNYMDALCAESQIQMCLERKLKQNQRIMDITELIMRVLKNENWGMFYKNQPMRNLETQDGGTLYEVNQVDECEIETIIHQTLTKWQSSQINSNQNKSSTTG
jgi:hypothetical protein